jgi:hypothetical protein
LRRTVKRVLSAVTGMLLATAIAVPAMAGDAYQTQFAGDGYSVASVEETTSGGKNPQRTAVSNVQSSGLFESHLCVNGVDNSTCQADAPGVQYEARQFLEPCLNATSENCIESLEIIQRDGSSSKATLVETLKANPTLPAVPEQGLFESQGISLYRDDSTTPSTLYAVSFWDYLSFDKQSRKWVTTNIDASVYPYRVKEGSFSLPLIQDGVGSDGKPRLDDRADPNCDWNDATRCGIRQDFAPGTRIRLSARAAKTVSGWFRGRITKPDITLNSFSATNNRISVEGDVVEVARMRAVLSPSTSSAEQQQAIIRQGGNGGNTVFHNEIKYPFANWGDFAWIELFRGLANDTAAGTSSVWTFSTLNGQSTNACMSDTTRVLGMVTTNATMFNGNAPDFIDGMLTYKVAGMHYLPDGKTLSEGTYDLLMRSDVARCLYGFTSAPISATISVIGANGEEKTAVTTVNETKDGWLKLAAYGFTFSQPTIKVRLTQQEPATAVPTPTATPVVTVVRKLIACVKGSSIRHVSGRSAKCPAGYRKK